MKKEVSGALCPECESRRTLCTGTGYSDEGYRIRRRRCMDCDAPSFITAEVVVPATWGELESSWRLKQLLYFRKRQGYQGRTEMARFKPQASLDVKVRVTRRRAAA